MEADAEAMRESLRVAFERTQSGCTTYEADSPYHFSDLAEVERMHNRVRETAQSWNETTPPPGFEAVHLAFRGVSRPALNLTGAALTCMEHRQWPREDTARQLYLEGRLALGRAELLLKPPPSDVTTANAYKARMSTEAWFLDAEVEVTYDRRSRDCKPLPEASMTAVSASHDRVSALHASWLQIVPPAEMARAHVWYTNASRLGTDATAGVVACSAGTAEEDTADDLIPHFRKALHYAREFLTISS